MNKEKPGKKTIPLDFGHASLLEDKITNVSVPWEAKVLDPSIKYTKKKKDKKCIKNRKIN